LAKNKQTRMLSLPERLFSFCRAGITETKKFASQIIKFHYICYFYY
jgi:hypothetical protein